MLWNVTSRLTKSPIVPSLLPFLATIGIFLAALRYGSLREDVSIILPEIVGAKRNDIWGRAAIILIIIRTLYQFLDVYGVTILQILIIIAGVCIFVFAVLAFLTFAFSRVVVVFGGECGDVDELGALVPVIKVLLL